MVFCFIHWFCSIGTAKSDPNMNANSANLFFSEPLTWVRTLPALLAICVTRRKGLSGRISREPDPNHCSFPWLGFHKDVPPVLSYDLIGYEESESGSLPPFCREKSMKHPLFDLFGHSSSVVGDLKDEVVFMSHHL